MNVKQLETLKKNNEDSRDFVRSCINFALMVLIKEEDLANVSISKLCAVAGVSRTAFYRNYNCVQDVLEDNIKAIAFDIASKISTDIYNNWLMVFKTAEKNYTTLEAIVKAGYDYKIHDVFMSLLPKSEENRTIQAIWLSIFITMITKWIKEKSPKKVEDAARLAYKYTKDIPLSKI